MNYYSQVGQDKWVYGILKKGFFVDVGAHDGVEISNTFALEQAGWTGLCIEPNPVSFRLLEKNRGCLKCNAAAYSRAGFLKMTECGAGSTVTELGTIEVPCDTLLAMFQKYNVPHRIDYISLDVEGCEPEVLSVFPFETYQFGLMTVEHNLYKDGPANKHKCHAILTAQGYVRVAEDVEIQGLPLEDWYSNPDLL